MSMKIEVFIPEAIVEVGGSSNYLARCMEAIGYTRGVSLSLPPLSEADMAKVKADIAAGPNEVIMTAPSATVLTEAPKRERGKPSGGRARRTKEEIAEDEAADAAEALNGEVMPPETQSISIGEERIDPAQAAQDAADERAQAEATKAAEGKAYTRDDVRSAMVEYVNAHGSGEMAEDLLKVLAKLYPANDVTKLSEIPDNSDDFLAVINGLSNASKEREALK